MHIVEETVDDLMLKVLDILAGQDFSGTPTRAKLHGKTSEIIGCILELTNPRARLSRSETRSKPFSALGELLWYLSKTNELEFISYYISEYKKETEDGKVYGGYGPRIFNLNQKFDQFENVIKLLKRRSESRRAVIQIFDGEDIAGNKDRLEIPCTCTLQFLIRESQLHMVAHMRSNDAYKGLPHDIFAFTMLQEIIANIIGVEMGRYLHLVGSLHLYENDVPKVREYLNEGYQSTKLHMPAMPKSNPRKAIKIVLAAEQRIRNSEEVKVDGLKLPPYWADLVRLLQVYALYKKGTSSTLVKRKLAEIKNQLADPIFNIYINQKTL